MTFILGWKKTESRWDWYTSFCCHNPRDGDGNNLVMNQFWGMGKLIQEEWGGMLMQEQNRE